jgi:hypothetical protein
MQSVQQSYRQVPLHSDKPDAQPHVEASPLLPFGVTVTEMEAAPLSQPAAVVLTARYVPVAVTLRRETVLLPSVQRMPVPFVPAVAEIVPEVQ